ncbi:MAG: hypothetical protein A2133_03305 [Actinobacteria bacterium RBG_16_64_13]|nr:MAG: hypothetical protein A2133_03305 [Actinobacteria bacterium RBG_16_64_13]
MNQSGQPIYTTRGAQPRPFPGQRALRTSWRASMMLVSVMFGWLIFTFALAAIAAPNDPNVEVPVQVGLGVVVTPADGWYSAADDWEVGPNAVSFQKSGALVAFAAEEFAGTNDQLLTAQLGFIEQDFESYRSLPASSSTVSGDLPGLTALFTGVSSSSRLEGELVVATSAGTGVIMLAIAPEGQLSRVQGDLGTMLDNLVVPR